MGKGSRKKSSSAGSEKM